jgi:hypothetical protein
MPQKNKHHAEDLLGFHELGANLGPFIDEF